jgi:hypothetical protein
MTGGRSGNGVACAQETKQTQRAAPQRRLATEVRVRVLLTAAFLSADYCVAGSRFVPNPRFPDSLPRRTLIASGHKRAWPAREHQGQSPRARGVSGISPNLRGTGVLQRTPAGRPLALACGSARHLSGRPAFSVSATRGRDWSSPRSLLLSICMQRTDPSAYLTTVIRETTAVPPLSRRHR